jgi:pimeloyl-ACP methyl ester carboxylesterase
MSTGRILLTAALAGGLAAAAARGSFGAETPPAAAPGEDPKREPTGVLSVTLGEAPAEDPAAKLPPAFSEGELAGLMAAMVTRGENPQDGDAKAAEAARTVKEAYAAMAKDAAFAKLPCALEPALSGRQKPPCHYYLYVPEGYQADREYPALLFLHGAGGNLRCGLYLSVEHARRHGVILICPTFRNGEWWTEEGTAFAMRALDDVAKRYRVNAKAVGIAGVSNGAIGAWVISEKLKEKFCAVISVSGAFNGAKPVPAGKGPPVYIVHGARDAVISPELSRAAYAVLKERPGTVLKELPEAGHLAALVKSKEVNEDAYAWFEKLVKNGAARE